MWKRNVIQWRVNWICSANRKANTCCLRKYKNLIAKKKKNDPDSVEQEEIENKLSIWENNEQLKNFKERKTNSQKQNERNWKNAYKKIVGNIDTFKQFLKMKKKVGKNFAKVNKWKKWIKSHHLNLYIWKICFKSKINHLKLLNASLKLAQHSIWTFHF